MTTSPMIIDAAAVQAISYRQAAEAIIAALGGGAAGTHGTGSADVTGGPPRAVVEVDAGQLLLMPGEVGPYAGVKIASVAPGNTDRGLPRIQGSFVLLDRATLGPLTVIDGPALTTLRTPAVSAAAATRMAAPGSAGTARVVVFGAGPQSRGHVEALHQVVGLGEVFVIARQDAHAQRLAQQVTDGLGVTARPGTHADLARADIVVCATTAADPLFTADEVAPGAFVIAVGSHEPHIAELDPDLMGSAQVVVEDRATALREAGDVVRGIEQGSLREADLIDLAELFAGTATIDTTRTRVFKSVGMAWEDVVVAARVYEAVVAREPGTGRDHGERSR